MAAAVPFGWFRLGLGVGRVHELLETAYVHFLCRSDFCFTVNYIWKIETFFLVKPHRFVFIFFGLMISKDLDFLLQILYVRCEGKRQNVWYVWNRVRITEFFYVVHMQWNMCTVSCKPKWVGHLLFSDFRRILWGEKLIVENFLLKFAEKSNEWPADESTKLRKCPLNFKWNIECPCMIKDKDINWLQTLELKSQVNLLRC